MIHLGVTKFNSEELRQSVPLFTISSICYRYLRKICNDHVDGIGLFELFNPGPAKAVLTMFLFHQTEPEEVEEPNGCNDSITAVGDADDAQMPAPLPTPHTLSNYPADRAFERFDRLYDRMIQGAGRLMNPLRKLTRLVIDNRSSLHPLSSFWQPSSA